MGKAILRAAVAASLFAASIFIAGSAQAAAGDIAIVVEQGDPAPGLSEGTVFGGSLNSAVINADGIVAFLARVAGGGTTTSNNLTIWVGEPGNLELLVRKGDPAPGTEEGTVFTSFNGRSLVITQSGDVAFQATLGGDSVDASNNLGFWVGSPGDVSLIVRAGDEAPGAPGTFFTRNGLPAVPMYTDGGFVMRALLTGDVTLQNDRGVWAGPPGALDLVIRSGAEAPAVEPGAVITSGILEPVISLSGEVAIPAQIQVGLASPRLVYIGQAGSLDVFVRDGDVFPDLEPGESLRAPLGTLTH